MRDLFVCLFTFFIFHIIIPKRESVLSLRIISFSSGFTIMTESLNIKRMKLIREMMVL